MKIYVSHSRNFDFENELYSPLRNSRLSEKHSFFFPHENGKNINTKKEIEDSDLILAEVSFPSTGQGIELGWASAANIPIILLSKKETDRSSSLQYLSNEHIEYVSQAEMIEKITNLLNKNS